MRLSKVLRVSQFECAKPWPKLKVSKETPEAVLWKAHETSNGGGFGCSRIIIFFTRTYLPLFHNLCLLLGFSITWYQKRFYKLWISEYVPKSKTIVSSRSDCDNWKMLTAWKRGHMAHYCGFRLATSTSVLSILGVDPYTHISQALRFYDILSRGDSFPRLLILKVNIIYGGFKTNSTIV